MNSRNVRYYLAQILILTIAVGIGIWQASRQQEQVMGDLVKFAKIVTLNIPPDIIKSLRGDMSDLQNPQYTNLKRLVSQTISIETNARFAHILGIRPDNTLFFYADSEPENSPAYSPPGKNYTGASQQDLLVFRKKIPQTFTKIDRWGNWISVEIPIIDVAEDRVIASFDMDIPQSKYYQQIAFSGLVPILTGILFIFVLFVIRRLSMKDEIILNQRAAYFAFMAHDIKAPLSAIKWTAELMQMSEEATVEIKEKTATIVNKCREVASFIDNLVNTSKTDNEKLISNNLEKINIGDITKKIVSDLDLLIKQKNIQVLYNFEENLLVKADKLALSRAIMNLISNAIKYSTQDGSINIAIQSDHGQMIWSVKDSGIGIPKSDLHKVLAGYYRADNAKNQGIAGTGLGLYYVRKVVEAHHGKISLESEVNKGTAVIIILPLANI